MRAPNIPRSLLFVPDASASSSTPSLYPPDKLPKPSAPISPPSTTSHRVAPVPQYALSTPQPPGSYSARSARPAPPVSNDPGSSDPSRSRITRSTSETDTVMHELKTVNLPRDCLPRFLSIAALNTAQNRETCGLLLGKDRGHKFVVTTLLIPKQHSTSDTCTMDEEELVLRFTEERNLITLGWVSYLCDRIFYLSCDPNSQIHTHPSQSCRLI